MAKRSSDRIGELEDKLKQANTRIAELRRDLDAAEALVTEEREHVKDAHALIETWIEAFDMEQLDDGQWTFQPWLDDYKRQREEHGDLVRRWNKLVPIYNAKVAPRGVGRPLAASEAQCAQALKLHKAGASLRGIGDETGLGIGTVRTIVGKKHGSDRTSQRNELRRIEINRQEEVRRNARQRTRDSLPKRINDLLAAGRDLVARAKGLR
jgi:hypothetical protein